MKINVTITSRTGKISKGEVETQQWEKSERLKRAFKFLFGAWGLMTASAFLPIAHFFLVPSFFIAGPIGFYFMNKQTSVVLGGSGTCPCCGQNLKIVRGPDRWPLEDLCTGCQEQVTITH